MSLTTYKQKRNFKKTPEPAGGKASAKPHALHYVIQKHDASHLHYDFRLELDGTLKSWAVPKGPSLDPSRKALAVQVEDHPLDYENFEGTIPAGEYGGGTVMVWDHGTWEPLGDPHEGLRAGKLRFELHGDKLKGQWSLVQMHNGRDGRNWLLMKHRDAHAGTGDILRDAPDSVQTKRSLDEIATGRRAVWHSNRGQAPSGKGKTAENKNGTKTVRGAKSNGAAAALEPATKMPREIKPQLAMLAEHPPEGDQWVHEIKFDGYRLLAFIEDGKVVLRTRAGLDWTARFPQLVEPLKKLNVQTAILDGEAVVMDDKGLGDFQRLQNFFKSEDEKDKAGLRYFIFDLLYFNGHDVRQQPLLERKSLLHDLLKVSGSKAPLELSDHVRGSSEQVIERACAAGSEGIISKRADAPYVPWRDPSWLKIKCGHRQEFVIVGYTRSEKRSDGLRSLLLGYYDPQNGLVYCGRAGTGFDTKKRRQLLAELSKIEQKEMPTDIPPPPRERRLGHWVKPTMVCEAKFAGWTTDNILRQPIFMGLRLDKPAREVTREVAALVPGEPSVSSAARRAPTKVNGGKHSAIPGKPAENAEPRRGSTKNAPEPWAGIRMTHPDKLIYPKENLRKADLADYYALAAPFMLPHVVERPLALMRCPSGLNDKCFFMRNWSETLPPDIDKVQVSEGESHVMIRNAAGLFSLAQISALEVHTWNCRAADLEHADQIVFDLDPGPEVPWKQIVSGAQTLRDLLVSLGMTPFVKTSGGKGLHLTIPIKPNIGWKEVTAFTKTLATYQSNQDTLFIAHMSKAARTHKIYIDFLRNDRFSTAVAPYSTRARAGAAVSMPLEWEQLADVAGADHFRLKTAGKYLEKRKRDPWSKFTAARVDLHKIAQRANFKE